MLVLAACDDSSDGVISKEQLHRLTLQPSDLPGFSQFDAGAVTVADLDPGPRMSPDRFGRLAGWKARYRRADPEARSGPQVVVSFVDLFEDPAGAKDDLAAYEEQFGETASRSRGRAQVAAAPRIGAGTVAQTVTQATGGQNNRFYSVAWRDGEVTAFVSIQGVEGTVSMKDAVALARAQQRRIRAAGG